MRLYVGNLPFSVDSNELRTIFEEHGQVVDATTVMDRETGRARGFGFVEFANREDGEKAIEQLNGKDVGGRTIVVNEARERQGGGGGGGGGGRGHGGGRGGW